MVNISIIVPIYNVELSIRKRIESIIEQECEGIEKDTPIIFLHSQRISFFQILPTNTYRKKVG